MPPSTPDRLGRISDRGDNEDERGYPGARREVRLIQRYARLAGRDVLEIGCGNGRLTVEYAGDARRVVALEPNRTLLASARARARALGLMSVRFAAQSAQTGIRDGPYDVVLFSWSL